MSPVLAICNTQDVLHAASMLQAVLQANSIFPGSHQILELPKATVSPVLAICSTQDNMHAATTLGAVLQVDPALPSCHQMPCVELV